MEAFKVSTKTEQKLKEFLGVSMPNPLDGKSIMLHDLLSKPFCAEMRLACKWGDNSLLSANRGIEVVHGVLSQAYLHGGLPAVESALIQMMEGK